MTNAASQKMTSPTDLIRNLADTMRRNQVIPAATAAQANSIIAESFPQPRSLRGGMNAASSDAPVNFISAMVKTGEPKQERSGLKH